MTNLIKNKRREKVFHSYKEAYVTNEVDFLEGKIKATSQYIYENQKEDALSICNKLYNTNTRVISIVKKTKVGMDGLMIEIATIMATHSDDEFVLDPNNIFFITGMSNKSWEDDMKNKIPNCFNPNVYHHGKLQKLKQKLNNVKDALIIIDEIDVGDKEDQKLHKVLKESGVLTIEYIENNNIRLVVVSATIINELRELFKWGDKHEVYYMTIPDNYIGHKEFLELGIIQEFYPINTIESANKWITEDILEKYGSDYRVHIIRTDKKNQDFILDACIMNSINFKNHTSDDRISTEELSEIFDNITNHIVIAVKGFYRRANLIPNIWKMKIGAMHELYVKKLDTNVQVQGLPGRMTGYWKETIMNGHKTGPYRTSIKAMEEDEHFYENAFSEKHHSSKKSKSSMLHPDNIPGLNYSKPVTETFKRIPVIINIDENCLLFKEKKRDNRIKYIEKLLKKEEKYTKLLNFILNKDVFCVQITHPQSDNSYKKHITDVITACNNNTPYSVDLKNEHKSKNNWQVFIDDKENRLCFVIWCVTKDLYSDSEEK